MNNDLANLFMVRVPASQSMAAIAVRCKSCGILLPTGIRTGWVARPVIGERHVACPGCGDAAQYHGADFLVLG